MQKAIEYGEGKAKMRRCQHVAAKGRWTELRGKGAGEEIRAEPFASD